MRGLRLVGVVLFAVGCATTTTTSKTTAVSSTEPVEKKEPTEKPPSSEPVARNELTEKSTANESVEQNELIGKSARADRCGNGQPMVIHFFDVHQALAALIELPGGEHILVDTGDSRTPTELYTRMADMLTPLLNGKPISMLWITHQHADHLGHADDVLTDFNVNALVDNGLSSDTPQVKRMHAAARKKSIKEFVVSPGSPMVPLTPEASVKLTAVVPTTWNAHRCESADPNLCSIGLRIDYCNSSVLFVGDAEAPEEAALTGLKPVTLLQAGHHGSSTSSSAKLVDQLQPQYVLISSGAPREDLNATFCHPSRSSLRRIASAVRGAPAGRITAFKDDELKCRDSRGMGDWEDVPVGQNIYSTARDGDVTFTTYGDGTFEVATEPTRGTPKGAR